MQLQLRRTGEHAYFAASNSRGGFYSYYEHCFRGRVDRLYCIKGGPGTGKSTLMREIMREGERRGYRAEAYYCSSDADSLDGVLLFGRTDSIGLLDATSPHAFEPRVPGARENIIDLGRFWNEQALTAEYPRIETLNRQKSDAYRACYRCLAGVGELSDALRDSVTPCVDIEKMNRTARRLTKGLGGGEQGDVEIRLRDSLGLGGRVRLDTYMREAERLCLIEDYHDSAYLLMDQLVANAGGQKASMRISRHPILPDRTDAMLLTESKTAFVVCETQELSMLTELWPRARVISMRRMMQKESLRVMRDELRRLDRLRAALLDEAISQMSKASNAHFCLERIYSSAMDFAAKERYTAELCRRLFDAEK